jgi:Cupredoxin-like domain
MRPLFFFVLSLLLLAHVEAKADDVVEQNLAIKDHHFVPAAITLPQGKKIKLMIANQDPTPAEFESYALNREKVVDGNSSITVFIGPLAPGTYTAFDDFHRDTTTLTLIAQ